MLFRNKQGNLVEINRKNFTNDKSYYNYIISLNYPISPKINKTTETIIDLIKK
jgi:hypothetical protein